MNKEILIEKRNAVETKFSELQNEQTTINEELIRFQGEYRELTELINELEATETTAAPIEATETTAEPIEATETTAAPIEATETTAAPIEAEIINQGE